MSPIVVGPDPYPRGPANSDPEKSGARREAVFHSQTVAHKRSYPDDLAQSRTASEASVAYP